jgi:hypothetical protein
VNNVRDELRNNRISSQARVFIKNGNRMAQEIYKKTSTMTTREQTEEKVLWEEE